LPAGIGHRWTRLTRRRRSRPSARCVRIVARTPAAADVDGAVFGIDGVVRCKPRSVVA
jgi:hypothetical protein